MLLQFLLASGAVLWQSSGGISRIKQVEQDVMLSAKIEIIEK
jgi:hypothetical protein